MLIAILTSIITSTIIFFIKRHKILSSGSTQGPFITVGFYVKLITLSVLITILLKLLLFR